MYRKILVPLDGSRFAESALPLALSLSRRTSADLHLVTVQEPVASFRFHNEALDLPITFFQSCCAPCKGSPGADKIAEIKQSKIATV